MSLTSVLKYFPDLSQKQVDLYTQMESLYIEWNEKVNVISRKDVENLFERHILHSLAIAKFFTFPKNTRIIDVGTGGGFPGIPLAVFFEDCHFTLIDSIGKKIKVVEEISTALKLTNVKAMQVRSDQFKGDFDYIVSRAVTNLPSFFRQTKHLVKKGSGIVYLKGGDFDDEIQEIRRPIKQFIISKHFNQEFFETKKVVFINLKKKK